MSTTPPREARVLVRPADDADRFLPEGPQAFTFQGRAALLWINIQTAPDATSGALHLRFWDTGERRTWALPGRPGFASPTDRPGVVFVGMDKQVGTFDLEVGIWHRLATIPDDNPRTIVNDGQVVPGGRAVVFGTKDTKFANPIANLYLFTLDDDAVSLLAAGQTCSNGKVIARYGSGLVLYDVDTPTRKVARYQLDVAGRVAAPDGDAVDVSGCVGFPDGMRDAGEGTAVIAFYNPAAAPFGKAIRFDLVAGKSIDEWHVPASPRVTCPCLVSRPDGVKLVLTTATEGMPTADRATATQAGDLFVADTDILVCPTAEIVRFSA